MERNKIKEEAIKRMKMLEIMPQPIKEFKEDGLLNLSENGILYWLNDEQNKMVRDWEAETGNVVYHVIHSYTNIGELFSFLYVSNHEEEWDRDEQCIKDGETLAYVVNKDMPDCSEYGYIGVKPFIGGVLRTW